MAEHSPAPLPPRVRLVVLFGGRSAEHDVSRVSAHHVLRAVDPARYDVVPVGITRDGRWVLAEQAAELLSRGLRDELPAALAVAGPDVDPLPTLVDRPLGDRDAPAEVPTVVLPILHGPNGEDGTVQGLLELAGLPYVGTGVLGSSVAMDKAMAKTVFDARGIPQARWREVRSGAIDASLVDELVRDLGTPLFVKPANMGSSVGVSRVEDAAGLGAALERAAAYDDVLVVEEGVAARELEIAVLGNEDPRASVVGEVVPGAEFYDYEDKYENGAATTVIPAELPDDVAEAARALALRAYRALRCEGMSRVDLFLEGGSPDGDPGGGRGLLVNEVNTIPGFTPISMYPMLWEASGLPYPQLVDELVALALERHGRRSRFTTDR
ncbi:MAG: D-alanine--D-alanine ligase family protein [Microthrixaceae bacterium]